MCHHLFLDCMANYEHLSPRPRSSGYLDRALSSKQNSRHFSDGYFMRIGFVTQSNVYRTAVNAGSFTCTIFEYS